MASTAQVPSLEQFDYFIVRYCPNLLTDEFINVGVVLWSRSSFPSGFCSARFAPSWQERVMALDPSADLDVLAAIFEDIKHRLDDPKSRQEMLGVIQDSFSQAIRISEKRECVSEDPTVELETIAARYF